MFRKLDYRREAAVAYAHRWAYGRNPQFYDYETLGGDCTNFASQCVFAGGGVMNYTPTYGWYYADADHKAPAWTGVVYFRNFMLRQEASVGPYAREVRMEEIEPGDVIQLSFDGESYQHTPIVVAAHRPVSADEILVAAHSYDADNRPLSTYRYARARYLHIEGVYLPPV